MAKIQYYIKTPVLPKATFSQIQQQLFDKSMAKYQEFYERTNSEAAPLDSRDSEATQLPMPLDSRESKIHLDSRESKIHLENANIDPILYDFEERKKIFIDPGNVYEKQWKSRALYESTPRGNVLMHYNPFTLSFSYYSDEQNIPYSILKKLAVKYVVMFRCKDFYIDPDNYPANKMLELLQKEEDAVNGKKSGGATLEQSSLGTQGTDSYAKGTDSYAKGTGYADVFATLKNYRTETSRPPNKANNKQKKPVQKVIFSNKFVRIGKISEFNILALPPSKKVQAVNELLFGSKTAASLKDFFDDLEIVEHEQTNVASESTSSYAMFKKLKTKTA